MPTSTPNYDFQLPTEGADTDLWGGFLNGNWSSLDTLLKSLQDEVNTLRAQTIIPVGGLYFSSSDTNPAATLGYGTWAAFAEGRAIVGVGTAGGGEFIFGPEQEEGKYTVPLTADNLPGHAHNTPAQSIQSNNAGNHSHDFSYNGIKSDDSNQLGNGQRHDDAFGERGVTDAAGNHSHTINIPATTSSTVGNDVPHLNIQPSIGVYVYKRTA